MAIQKVKEYAEQGYTQAVLVDLSKYFDTLNHELLMNLLRKNIHDKRVIELIKRYLKAGVMENGQVIPKLDRTYCSELFAKKVITAGMQPKLNAAFTAQAMGVAHVIITDDLDNHGTEIVKEEEDDDAACVSNV